MNTYHIKYFLDAAKNKSVSASAQINHISHSAVSLAIRSLENELGIELLHHGKRKFEITSDGASSLVYLEDLLNQLNFVKSKLKNSHTEPIGELVIWAPQSLIVDQLMQKIKLYREKYPQVQLKIQTGTAYLVRQSVELNRCQLGIAVDDQKMENFSHQLINKGEFVLVHKNKFTDFQKCLLKNEVFTTAHDKVEVVHLKNELKKHHTQATLSTHIMSWGLIKEFALNGFGVAYVPEYVVKKELESKKLFKIEAPFKYYKYHIKAIWNSQRPIDRNAELFLKLLG